MWVTQGELLAGWQLGEAGTRCAGACANEGRTQRKCRSQAKFCHCFEFNQFFLFRKGIPWVSVVTVSPFYLPKSFLLHLSPVGLPLILCENIECA